jgi:hypothetical protein
MVFSVVEPVADEFMQCVSVRYFFSVPAFLFRLFCSGFSVPAARDPAVSANLLAAAC